MKGHNKAYINAMVRIWHLLLIKERNRWVQWIPIATHGIITITITQFTFHRSIIRTEYEISQYSITRYNNLIAKWLCVEKFWFETVSLILVSYARLFSPCFGHCIWKVHENYEGLKFSDTHHTVPCAHINLSFSLFHSAPSSIGQDTTLIRPALLPQPFQFILCHLIIRRCCLNNWQRR